MNSSTASILMLTEGRVVAAGTIFVFREKHGLGVVHMVASQVAWDRLWLDDRVGGAPWVGAVP